MDSFAEREMVMPMVNEGVAEISLGTAKEIGLRLVTAGHFDDLAEACRAGLRRLADDARVIERLTSFGEEGMASGINNNFDIDAFVEDARPAR